MWNLATGEFDVLAIGNLCFVDGTACEVWPLFSEEEICERLNRLDESEFRRTFGDVRKRVNLTLEVQQRPEHVPAQNVVGMKKFRRMALVTKN